MIDGPDGDAETAGRLDGAGPTARSALAVDSSFAQSMTGAEVARCNPRASSHELGDDRASGAPRGPLRQVVGRGWWRHRRGFVAAGFGRAGTGQVLAGDPVVVTVESVGIAISGVFLGFGLICEVGAVVVKGLRRARRLSEDGGGEEGQGDKQPNAEFHSNNLWAFCKLGRKGCGVV